LEAKYLGIEADRVRLMGKDGRERKLPLDKLSPEGQKVVQQLQQKPATKDPFEIQ
jgi:site-specific recombinase XerC